MACSLMDGRYLCSTMAEARRLDTARNGGWFGRLTDEVIEIVGGVGDAVTGLVALPENLCKYVTGTDESYGQGRSWTYFGRSAQFNWSMNNPAFRTMEAVNSMVYGGVNLVLGYTPYLVTKELGLDIPYFSPPPATTREAARDSVFLAAILFGPRAIATGKKAMGLPEKAVPVAESAVARWAREQAAFSRLTPEERTVQRLFANPQTGAMMFKKMRIGIFLLLAVCLGSGCGGGGADGDSVEYDLDKKITDKNPTVTVKTNKVEYSKDEQIEITVKIGNPYNDSLEVYKGCGVPGFLIDGNNPPLLTCMAMPDPVILEPGKYYETTSKWSAITLKMSLGKHTITGKYYKILSAPVDVTIKEITSPLPGMTVGTPTLFIHGHGNDVWAWKPIIQKVKDAAYVYNNGEGIYAADAEKLEAGKYPSNSIWNFGYYKESVGDKEQYSYKGKIGGIPVDRTIILYKIKSIDAYTDYASCKKLAFFGQCDPNSPIATKDGGYANAVSYAQQLKRAVDGILKATGAKKINIVAHSMGGLVTRAYLKWLGGDGLVDNLLLVGTPNNGISDLQEHILQFGLILAASPKNIPPDSILWMKFNEDLEMYAKNVDDYHFDKVQTKLPLFEGQSWIYHLNKNGLIPSSTKLATIAGTNNKIVDQWIIDLANAWFSTFSGFTVYPPSDGVVNVSEVHIPGAVFNKEVYAAHGREGPGKGFGNINDPEQLLTECSEVAKTITDWILTSGSVKATGVGDDPVKTEKIVLDDAEVLSNWSNIAGDLDTLTLSPDHKEGNYSIHFGGVDEGGTWVGQLVKTLSKSNWTKAKAVRVWLKRGPVLRGGTPSLTFSVQDKMGAWVVLYRDEDVYLNWSPGGGWRTLISNFDWQEYVLPIRGEKNILWSEIKALKIELRKTVLTGGKWDKEPDDVYMDHVRLEVIWSDADGDSVNDFADNCPQKYNPDQYDGNDNGIGDACEPGLPKAFDILIEDAEDISDWTNIGGDLDKFQLSGDKIEGKSSMVLGGKDQGGTWVGQIIKTMTVDDWSKAPNIKFFAKRGSSTSTKGNPSITFVAIDGNGKQVQLSKSGDTHLPWPGGGWRTIISNTNWKEYLIPIKPADINYSNIQKLRIEMRKTIYNAADSWTWDMEPDDVYIDNLRLDPYEAEQVVKFEDKDGDGMSDSQDNCPEAFNPVQSDWNTNGVGDACEIPKLAGQPPNIAGVPVTLPLIISKAYVKTVDQKTIITSDQGLSFVKMSCGGGVPIKGVPAFDPVVAKNFYSFNIQIGPIEGATTCQISATDTTGLSSAASFQILSAQ